MTFAWSYVWQDSSIPCNYRIAQEGLAALLPLISAQCFRPTVDEFERIVTERSVPVPHIAPAAAPAVAAVTGPISRLLTLLVERQTSFSFRCGFRVVAVQKPTIMKGSWESANRRECMFQI